ncbi:MAG: type I restriction endonuclease subunit R [Rubrobacteraceae bacterium]
MSPSDTSERGLESLIVSALTGRTPRGQNPADGEIVGEAVASYGGGGYVEGDPRDYDRDHAVDLDKLLAFLRVTQPEKVEQLGLEEDGAERRRFLARLQGAVSKYGVVDVLRGGVKHGPASVDLFYGTPSPGNERAKALFEANVFSVTRQLRYNKDSTAVDFLDLAIFVNGLPVATFEIKNRLTRQTVEDAVEQYRRDRNSRELLFQFGRCLVHFALDEEDVRFCTHLRGRESWFLPFNKGWNDGAGNPPNPDGVKTAYLWREILARESLSDIIENYAQIVEESVERRRGGSKRRTQIFPRYHQLDAVRKLLADAKKDGPGRRYLVQHSAGSGKSNSIAWLVHQLVGLEENSRAVFDSVVVVTDRLVLDRQLKATIRQFAQVSATIGDAERSADLREFLAGGKKIIITTVQKFPFVLDEIGDEHRGRSFAIVIDEAHSSQGGRTTAAMGRALGGEKVDEEETPEDAVNRAMEERKMLPNASYFAFTATPKRKTLRMFGEEYEEGDEKRYRAFHTYTMKQAVEEGFIVDVLGNYTPVRSYYHLIKSAEEDPEFEVKTAQKKLRRYVEGHEHAIRHKAEIMVDHFHEQTLAKNKVGGEARAMVVTNGIERAIRYFYAIREYLEERKSPHKAVVAFSGEHEWGGAPVTEATLNGFRSGQIPDRFREAPYRFLVVADKFQTGYDEPLLHTMYVDKPLSDIKAVQTLSRLNRAHPKKHDTFVLDFYNEAETIRKAFEPYYRTTILSQEIDPNRLHTLKYDLDRHQVYTFEEVEVLVGLYLDGADRDRLDPILDSCVARYVETLDEEGQVDFKGNAKAFVRLYDFLGTVLPYKNADWEKLFVFLTFLIPKLPAPSEEDLSQGILEAIDMDSYRTEAQAAISIALVDREGEIGPIPDGGGAGRSEPETDRLSNILRDFNGLFGNVEWKDADKIGRVITEEIPTKVSADSAYRNAAKNSDRENARIEHNRALQKVILDLSSDHNELLKQFYDDPSFKRWLSESVFSVTYPNAVASEDEKQELLEQQTQSWMEEDLSHLNEFESYEWEEGEREEGAPVRYEPGVGFVIVGTEHHGDND